MPIILQNFLIILLAAYMAWDGGSGGQILCNWPVTIGLIMGLIMGNVTTALIIAGTLQLMSLGVAGIGGASIPEYGLAAIVSIYIAITTHASTGTAIAIGLPVGILTLNLDVLVKLINNYFAHLAQKRLHQKKFAAMHRAFYYSVIVWSMKYVIPVMIVIIFGPAFVKSILHVIPAWLTNGLNIAGGMLPVVGVGMLMRYMPTKKYLTYLIIGFVFAAYMKLPILGVALLGLAIAMAVYRINSEKLDKSTETATSSEDEGDDYDE